MLILGLDHVQICVPRAAEAAARAFYRDVLELEEIPKPDVLAGRGGCWFRCGHAMFHIGVEDDFHPPGKAHPAFRVANLERMTEKLRQAGCEVTDGIPIPGFARFDTRDPFGNRLEFLQALE